MVKSLLRIILKMVVLALVFHMTKAAQTTTLTNPVTYIEVTDKNFDYMYRVQINGRQKFFISFLDVDKSGASEAERFLNSLDELAVELLGKAHIGFVNV